MENNEHKRRVRYQGSHPRNFGEKYKELQPEKYADTVAKIIKKGNTPAGMHIPICVNEILEILQIKPGQKGLDATLGYGGHTLELLKRLDGSGHLYSLDVDSIELVKTRERLEKLGFGADKLTILQKNFALIDEVDQEYGKFDFVMADLGISSMQVDNPDRGFSYKAEGPLDLRLDPERGITAAERLKSISQEELTGMLLENSDEPYAEKIAAAITREIASGGAIETTTRLREIIEQTLSFVSQERRKDAIKKSCQRVFQALRIDVNNEFEVLYQLLEKLPDVLVAGGRVAVLTFHSGEDRLVKKSFKSLLNAGVYKEIADEVIRPSAEECASNSRAKSAKLRWAVKV